MNRTVSEKITTLKSRKKRSLSSRKWLLRQLNDPYVAKSKALGYRSRAAFKLIDINTKFKILKPDQIVVDLGCAPGGWLQVAQEYIKTGTLIGLDLQEVEPVGRAIILQGDFTEEATLEQLYDCIGNAKVDVVLSDMAASACGIPHVDYIRIMALVQEVVTFCERVMNEGGCMIAKVLRGGTDSELLMHIKQRFRFVAHYKPPASRSDSSEMYIVARGYRQS